MIEDLYDVIIIDATRRITDIIAIECGYEWAQLEAEAVGPKLERGETVKVIVSGICNEGEILRK
jgi:hypothetical protein